MTPSCGDGSVFFLLVMNIKNYIQAKFQSDELTNQL